MKPPARGIALDALEDLWRNCMFLHAVYIHLFARGYIFTDCRVQMTMQGH